MPIRYRYQTQKGYTLKVKPVGSAWGYEIFRNGRSAAFADPFESQAAAKSAGETRMRELMRL